MNASAVAEQLGGPGVLQHEIRTELDLIAALQEGLPATTLDTLVASGALSAREVEELIIPRRTLAHRRQKRQRLSAEESDRAARVARAIVLAEDTFQNAEKAAHWLRKPNRGLGGQVPLELLRTSQGAALLERALGQIGHGIFA